MAKAKKESVIYLIKFALIFYDNFSQQYYC